MVLIPTTWLVLHLAWENRRTPKNQTDDEEISMTLASYQGKMVSIGITPSRLLNARTHFHDSEVFARDARKCVFQVYKVWCLPTVYAHAPSSDYRISSGAKSLGQKYRCGRVSFVKDVSNEIARTHKQFNSNSDHKRLQNLWPAPRFDDRNDTLAGLMCTTCVYNILRQIYYIAAQKTYSIICIIHSYGIRTASSITESRIDSERSFWTDRNRPKTTKNSRVTEMTSNIPIARAFRIFHIRI